MYVSLSHLMFGAGCGIRFFRFLITAFLSSLLNHVQLVIQYQDTIQMYRLEVIFDTYTDRTVFVEIL